MSGSQLVLLGGAPAVAANYIEDVFSTYLYTGNSSTQTIINGLDFSTKGGMLWFANRSSGGTYTNILFDTVRGRSKYLFSYNSSGEGTPSAPNTDLVSFNTNGFTVGVTNQVIINNSGENYVAWGFREQPKFFDVVTYTGNGVNGRAISHNLQSTPGCMLIKNIGGIGGSWWVYHRGLTNPTDTVLILQSPIAEIPQGGTVFGVSSSSFNVYYDMNAVGENYVAYLFAHDAGGFGADGSQNVISCGSFTTNSLAQATITLGYEPQWLLIKRINSTGNWQLMDIIRGNGTADGNVTNQVQLFPNLQNAEGTPTYGYGQPTSTGFYCSGQTAINSPYIYIAIRRGPMKTPEAGTEVFDVDAWTGNDTAGRNITTGFPVDLTIEQLRTAGTFQANLWFDRLRGYSSTSAGNSYYLRSQNTDAESYVADYNYVPSMDGFAFGSVASGANQYNDSGVTAVGWNFRRAPGFFDIVCYTGTSDSSTVFNHNLGKTPELMIVKTRSYAATGWMAINCSAKTYGNLNGTNSFIGPASGFSFTSTTFSYGVNYGNQNNRSPETYVAYLFATVDGVSKVGTYTGTGTTLQINCGFTGGARFVLIKRTDSTGDWYVWDSARGIVSGDDPYLLLNSTAAEVTNTDYVDTYAQGFEISSTAPAAINANGGTYIFLAIA